MIKSLRMKEFNTYVKNGYIKLRPFPGTTMKQLLHYTAPSLVDKIPSIVIIYGGCNVMLTGMPPLNIYLTV